MVTDAAGVAHGLRVRLHYMMVELVNFVVKRRLPQSALTRSTDGGSDRLHGSNSTPPPCWTGRGVTVGRCHHPSGLRSVCCPSQAPMATLSYISKKIRTVGQRSEP
jgi:hypothetical protein